MISTPSPLKVTEIRQFSREVVRELGILNTMPIYDGVSPSQGHALLELARSGPLMVMEIAEKLRLDKSTASRVVAYLIDKGWVASHVGSDQRCKAVALTKRGLKMVAQIDEVANKQVGDALNFLSETERDSVASAMALYANALKASRRRAEYVIRPIQSGDDPKLSAVIREVREGFGPYGVEFSAFDPEINSLYSSYKNPNTAFFVVTKDDEIFGGAGVGPLPNAQPDICELRKMYLLPAARGLGLGKELARLCIEAAREMGYRTCFLETLKRMDAARAVYLSMGFLPLPNPTVNTGHDGCDAWFSRDL